MPLWFMAFGGSVPIGNLLFGPVIDAIGARWVLGLGAVVAVVLGCAGPICRRLAPSGVPRRDASAAMQPAPAERTATALTSTTTPGPTGPTAATGSVDRCDAVEVGADGDELDAELARPRRRPSRCAGVGIVELGHLAEHGDTPVGRHRRQRVERGAHRRRVGVVGVVDHDAAGVGGDDLHPHRRQLGPTERVGGRVDVDADDAGDGERGRGVGRHVRAAAPPARPSRAPHGVRDREARPGHVVEATARRCARRRPRRRRTSARPPSVEPAIAATRASSALSTAVPVAGRASTSSRLGPGDAVDAADPFGVRGGDRRDDTDVGPADGAQPGDLAEARACPSRGRAPRCRRGRRGS